MTTETLRDAARLMRERAEAATPGPWRTNVRRSLQSVTTADGGPTFGGLTVATTGMPHHPGATEDAEHIASWHPAVALAVADWLDDTASQEERNERELGYSPIDISHELAIARVYLGEHP